MADWFKFYENDLDEMRLQWAIGEMPEVLNVWIVLLSEACRHKDGTLSGYNDDFELFAISKRLNITPPLVNKALSLLIKINYVERQQDGSLFIRKWMERQSEYCQKRTKLQNQTGENHWTKQNRTKNNGKELDSVPTVSRQYPDSVGQEERRGDKNIYMEALVNRLCSLYKRRLTTPWDAKELSKASDILKREEWQTELADIEKLYSNGYKYRRQNIITLLNNWSGELDRARNHMDKPNRASNI